MPVRRLQSQRGVAIITVLLMVSLATIAVTAMITRQQRDIRLASAFQGTLQSEALALAGERFAIATLKRDKDKAKRQGSDSLEDDWAQSLPPVPIGQGQITGCIHDVGSKFNLNNLIDNTGKASAADIERFRRLLNALNISTTRAEAVVDWLDSDSEPTGSNGAESEYYSSLTLPYRVANRPLVSTSELHLIKGFDTEEGREELQDLLPHVIALPISGSKINVNTATPAVLQSIDPLINDALGKGLTRWNNDDWSYFPDCKQPDKKATIVTSKQAFETIADFKKEAKNGDKQLNNTDGIGTTSDYFQIRVEVELGDYTLSQFTLVERNARGEATIIARSRRVN